MLLHRSAKQILTEYGLYIILQIIQEINNNQNNIMDPQPNNKLMTIQPNLNSGEQQNITAQKKKVIPTQMERKHVYDVYDRIAPHFSHTRYKPWPKIQKFLNQLPDNSTVFDIGCGNGKYLGVNKKLHMIGTDRSIGLLQTANEKSDLYELFAADSLSLPIRNEICDAFISIAVIHHFSNEEIRLKAIEQMTRIIKIGGEGLIYVWAYQHGQESVSKKKFQEQDCFVPWHLHFKYEKDLQNIDKTDATVDMQKKSVIYKRYYHVFQEKELDQLIGKNKQLQILESFYDKQNWACKVRRIS